MKRIIARLAIAILIAASIQPASAQFTLHRIYADPAQPLTYEQKEQIRHDEATMHRNWFIPPNPWRIFGGQTNYLRGTNCVQFTGRVLEVQKLGVRIRGNYGPIFDVPYGEVEFFVLNFPYSVAEDEIIGTNIFVAKPSGTYTYNAVSGGSRTLQQLDFGIICDPPAPRQLTREEITARSIKAAQKHTETEAKTLAWHQELAAKGDAYGQYKMGFRYLNGDGVDVDIDKAYALFRSAAKQGNKDAAAELANLPLPPEQMEAQK